MKQHKKSFRKLKFLCFVEEVNFALSECNAEMFIQKVCPNVEELLLHTKRQNSEKVFNCKVLRNRKWKNLYIENSLLKSDNNFLLKVVANCEIINCYIHKSSFTVRGVLNMLKVTLPKRSKSCSFGIDYDQEGIHPR